MSLKDTGGRPHGNTVLLSALIGLLVLVAGVGWRAVTPLASVPRAAVNRLPGSPAGLPAWLGGRSPAPPGLPAVGGGGDVGWAATTAELSRIAQEAGGHVSIAWRELGGPAPRGFALQGNQSIFAASTYKLPLLVAEAQAISSRRLAGRDSICFQPYDYESGWFDDYAGGCFTREQLAERTGLFSDNTAGHMLTRDLGGPDALNAAAHAMGATNSVFFTDNTTTANDLAAVLAGVGTLRTLNQTGLAWLKPKLANTQFESGIPAGVTGPAEVVHKVGEYDSVTNDAALVFGGRGGVYALVVCSDGAAGGGGDAAWPIIQQLSARVWAYEQTR